jgi:hypothetical protein
MFLLNFPLRSPLILESLVTALYTTSFNSKNILRSVLRIHLYILYYFQEKERFLL